MTGMRKRHSRDIKLKVVIEALSGGKSIAQIASDYRVHPTQIKEWKAQALETMTPLKGSADCDRAAPEGSPLKS